MLKGNSIGTYFSNVHLYFNFCPVNGSYDKRRTFCVRNPFNGACIRARCWSMGAVAINIGLVASLVGTLIGWFYLFLKFLMWQEKMAYFRKSLRKQIKSKHRTWHYGFQMVLPKLYLSSFCFRNQHIKLCISLPQHQFYYHIYYQRYSNLN